MANAQILVVEDEPIVAKNIQMELKGMGYTVPALASSGEDALQKVAETHPDLVLMDIVLKGDMDGVETAERLRESYDVPVIYLTAYADDQTLQRAKKTQPFGYLLKPYEERELETTIETALYKHQSERGLKEIQQWFASTLRCIRDAVIATDAQGCVRIFNHSAERLTGWAQEEALGKDLLNVFTIVNGETLTHSVTKALQKRAAFDLAKHSSLVAKDRRKTPVEGNVTPVYDDRGCFIGFILTFREVTDRQGNP